MVDKRRLDDSGATVVSTRSAYDRVATRYAAEIGDELRGKPLDRALLGMFGELTHDGPVADTGCGPGHVAQHLGRRHPGVFGFDLSPAMCQLANRIDAGRYGAADMTALPIGPHSLAGIVCFYAVIHLNAEQRSLAYREFARTLRPGGYALIAFHTRDADHAVGTALDMVDWWGLPVDLTFRFLDPAVEIVGLQAVGFDLLARTDRAPYPEIAHPSDRCYLLVRRRLLDVPMST